MGWFGHKNYDGDNTQTRHYDFLKWAKVYRRDVDIVNALSFGGTILPEEKALVLKKNLKLIVNKMPKKIIGNTYSNEDRALEWQMLLALLVDNSIKPTKRILKMSKEASEYLLGSDHSGGFTNPSLRRRHIRNLVKRAEAL